MKENQIVVLCSVPDQKVGERIATALVTERLAACVNRVGGIASTYRWQGKVEQAAECLLIIKTTAARFDAVLDRIKALHPYDLPEVVSLSITDGSAAYLKWITESTQ